MQWYLCMLKMVFIDVLIEQALKKKNIDSMHTYHALTRPPSLEAEARFTRIGFS